MGRVDGPSAGKIFHGKVWGGADESRKRVFFRGIRGKRVHGIVSHRVHFKNCAELGNEIHVRFSWAIGRQVKKSFRRGQGKVSDRLRAGIHTVRFKRSDGSEKHGYSVQSGEHRRSVHVDTCGLLVRNFFIYFFLLSFFLSVLELIIPLPLFIRSKRALNTMRITSTLMEKFHLVPSSSNITIGRGATMCWSYQIVPVLAVFQT